MTGQSCPLLATIKAQGGAESAVQCVEVKIRTSEDQTGNLLVYVVARGGDPATCQVLDEELKPLNMHERIEWLSIDDIETLPLSKITLKGRFQLSEALGWAGSCLPDVPHTV